MIKNILLTKEEKLYYSKKITDEEINKIAEKIKTGDIPLTIGEDIKQERIVKNITKSPITHCMFSAHYKGELYELEANSLNPATRKVEDFIHGKNKGGVRMCKFKDVYRHYNTAMFVRHISPELTEEHKKAIIEFYRIHTDKRFEKSLLQMYNAEKKIIIFNRPDTKRFFCSEFIAELLQFIGLMRGPKNGGSASKFYTPKDFIDWQPDDKRYRYSELKQIKPL